MPIALDRSSFVPLYYQLQEVLKERIESGDWSAGDVLPSEPELARVLGVSRVVVRQALAILQDDGQIVRIKGRGTFVAQPKLGHRAGGLSRLLLAPRSADVTIQVLDVRTGVAEPSIRQALEIDDDAEVLRVATLLSLSGVPLAISYSFFDRSEIGWLEQAAHPGRVIPPDLVLADHGIRLTRATVSIETSQCGQFEADRFKIGHRAPVFLVLCTESREDENGERPFEVARIEYRGDLLQFRLEIAPGPSAQAEAVWAFKNDAPATR